MLTSVLGRVVAPFDACPWGGAVGRSVITKSTPPSNGGLYTPAQRKRRDDSPWTIVQAVLAPVQFGVFLISLGLVLRFLATGQGELAATSSIIAKTLILYTIMVTGAVWEKQVFGRYLFAPAFFWEDTISMVVIALHTAYLGALFTAALSPHGLMMLALAAYATYAVNAAQFVLKLRAARQEGSAPSWRDPAPYGVGQQA